MKVKANVYVSVNGYPVLLREGDEIPEGVTVTNPAVLDDQEPEAPNVADEDRPTPEDVADGDDSPEDAPADEPEKAPAAPAPKPRTRAKKAPADSE